jgi:hypothetical protein
MGSGHGDSGLINVICEVSNLALRFLARPPFIIRGFRRTFEKKVAVADH